MDLQTREFEMRANSEAREISGIAVPLDSETELWYGLKEKIARGALTPAESGVKLFWQHREPIGLINRCVETDKGLEITAKISTTPRGDEAYQLVKDGVINRFSIGFSLEKWEDTETATETLRTVTAGTLHEVSLVSFPAYEDAKLTNVREKPSTHDEKEKTKMEDTTEIMERLAGLEERTFNLARTIEDNTNPAPVTAYRGSAGQALKELVSGKAQDILADNIYNRSIEAISRRDQPYTGGVIADDALAFQPTFLKDLTEIITQAAPLNELFTTATLPKEGMTFSFLRDAEDTLTVAKQAKEGDQLPIGRYKTKLETVEVSTYGGATVLSIQEIERSPAHILTQTLRRLAHAAGLHMNTVLKEFFKTSLATRSSAAVTNSTDLATLGYNDIFDLLFDCSQKMIEAGRKTDALLVTPELFKAMGHMDNGHGDKLMSLGGGGIGRLNPLTGRGDMLNEIKIYAVDKTVLGDTYTAALIDRDAITHYTSPLASLQDTAALTLTKGFSVYMYGAAALERPTGILPIKIGK